MCVKDRVDTEVTWIPLRAERIRLAPYPVLIHSFDDMSSTDQSIAKGYVDEFFTLSELNILKAYLEEQRDISVSVESFPIPFSCCGDGGTMKVPLRCLNEENGWRKFSLDKRSQMDLPFDIVGFFTLE